MPDILEVDVKALFGSMLLIRARCLPRLFGMQLGDSGLYNQIDFP